MSPSPEHIEYAEMLLRRATADLQACRVLAANSDIDDGAVGFHAQQTVEKALKVALVLAEVELPRTHDLELLVEQVQASGTIVPNELANIDWLTPWAVDLRYDEPTSLDRMTAVSVAESASDWATALLNPEF